MSSAPKWKDLFWVGAPLLILYGMTAARDLGTIDSGELATVAARLDVAHPTGYALYTCLGRVAVWLFPGTPILAVNLLSALAVILASVLATGIFRGLTAGAPSRSRGLVGHGFSAIWGGLLFGTSAVVWNQATGNEVYGLHLLFVVALVGWALAMVREEGVKARNLVGGAYLLGLALANHLSIVFVLPTVAVVWLRVLLRTRRRLALAGVATLLVLLGFSFNLFLPIRSSTEPLLDWGAPQDWERFWKHYLANQYRIWHFQSSDRFSLNLAGYLGSLPGRFSWPAVLLGFWGVSELLRTSRKSLAVLAGVFVVTVGWASGYEIFDLEPYFLPADFVVAACAVVGLASICRWLEGWALPRGRRSTATGLFVVLAVGCLLWQVVPGWSTQDRHRDRFIRTHLEMCLAGLPPGTLLFSAFWDAVVSPSLYLQQVEGFRPDLVIIDPELLRRAWYFPQLRRMHPGFLTPVEPEVDSFLEQLWLFDHGRPYDPTTIEARYRTLIVALSTAHPEGAVAFTGDVSAGFVQTTAIPEGLVHRVRDRLDEAGPLEPPQVERLLAAGYRPEDRIHRQVLEYWAGMIRARIGFLEATGRSSELPPWQGELAEVVAALQ